MSKPNGLTPTVEDLLQSTLGAYQAGRLAEAEVLCRQILGRYPGDANALFLLGVLALQTSRYEAAAEWIGQAIDATPDPPAQFHHHLGLALAHLGKMGEAERYFRRAIAIAPHFAEGYNGLGNVLKEQGRAEEAAVHYQRALELCPTSAVAHNNLGVLLQERGKSDEAIAHYRKAIDIDPTYADTYYNLGNALHATGSEEEAVAAYRRATHLRPDHKDAHLNLGKTLKELGRLDEAIETYKHALALIPHAADLHNNLGVILHDTGSHEEAIGHYQRAIELDPTDADAHYNLGNALCTLGRWEQSVAPYKRAVGLRPDLSDAYVNLGTAFRRLGRLREAEACYRQVVRLEPDRPGAYVNLGEISQEQGRLEEAERAMQRAIELDDGSAPGRVGLGNVRVAQGRFEEAEAAFRAALHLRTDYAEAYNNLASLVKYTSIEHPDLQEILRLLEAPGLSETNAMYLHFAAGKILDDCAAYDEAFAHYREANRIRRKSRRFDPVGFTELVERILRQFNGEFFSQRVGYGSDSEQPVFIVGVPRSGTTLVEQIIASHPHVHGAGELTKMRELALDLGARLGTAASYPEATAALTPELARSVAHEYAAVLSEGVDESAVRISDKIPINFFYLGLIALLFPRARVIHCRRDPLDVCLSIYFQYFQHGNDYAYDLTDIACFYRGYERIMAHWREVLPLKLYELCYEDLVANQAQKTRELITFLGLPWDERCLSFERNRRPVYTASVWQVRQPIYRSSIGRWRNYDKHLGPLKEDLGL